MYGMMGDNMMGTGSRTICMAKVYIPGQMDADMRDNFKWTSSLGTGFIHFQMEEHIKGIGIMTCSMVTEFLLFLMAYKNEAFGKKVE